MSFVRINRRPGRTKKVSVPRKEWVSTVSDLSVHKASPEELSRRHEIHRSRNRALAQWEMREKGQKRLQKKPQLSSPAGLDQARLRIIREVFSDQCHLQDVLARSDRAMAVVKDLFGDAPRRQTGFPNVTMAPDCDSDSELPVLQKPDPPTQLSLLSQSVMDQQALNEWEESAGENEEDQETSISFSRDLYRPKRKICKAKPPQWSRDQQLQQQNLPQTPCNVAGSKDQAALNATVAVEHLKSRQSPSNTGQSATLATQVPDPEPTPSNSGDKSRSSRTTSERSPRASRLDSSEFSSQSANQSSLELLQDMLGQVETELTCLEPQRSHGAVDPPKHRGLTGFSVALVACLGRIATHIRRKEEEAQKEAQARKRLEEEVMEQRNLIDALSAECLSLREDSAALQVSLQKRISELEQHLCMLIEGLGELASEKEEKELEPQDCIVPGSDAKPVPIETQLEKKTSDTSAVLLSPPRQRDSRAAPAAARSRSLHFGGSQATPSVCSLEDSDTSCTPSFISLPDRVLPHPAPLLDQVSQESVMQPTTASTHQNTGIQTCLGQFRPSPAGASLSRELGADRLTIVNTNDKQLSPSTGQQLTQQRVALDDSSVKLMEERLQELNRQSAAARARLLELIEQQKKTTSISVSPAISPIPPHSVGPNTAVGRLNQGSFIPVTEGTSSNANSRRSAGAVSPQSVQGRIINTQVELKGDGWFPLSAHIR